MNNSDTEPAWHWSDGLGYDKDLKLFYRQYNVEPEDRTERDTPFLRGLAKARCPECSRRIPTYMNSIASYRYEPHWTTYPWALLQRFTYGRTLCRRSDTEIDEETAKLSQRKIY